MQKAVTWQPKLDITNCRTEHYGKNITSRSVGSGTGTGTGS